MIVPLRDLVYIIPLHDPKQVREIVVPDPKHQRIDQGIVKYRGDAVIELRVGDHVAFSGYDGDQIVTEDEGILWVMREDDVKAIVDKEDAVRWYTEDHVREMLRRVRGDILQRDQAPDAKWVVERMESYINDRFFEELEF